ncbi:uncharacterized protein [Physcomitrium patens]|uniref:uncharacterized protein isoform X2 n=1 Tax=Physcomitrium patens TaxID=3218 RepID=UPI00016217AE
MTRLCEKGSKHMAHERPEASAGRGGSPKSCNRGALSNVHQDESTRRTNALHASDLNVTGRVSPNCSKSSGTNQNGALFSQETIQNRSWRGEIAAASVELEVAAPVGLLEVV